MSAESVSAFVFGKSPSGKIYREIVEYCCGHAATALLVVREPDSPGNPEMRRSLMRLSPFSLSVTLSKEWPGTILYGHEAELHTYQVKTGLGEVLKSMQNGLFDWVHPLAPEDLSFLRESGEPILVTTSHERDAYMLLSDREREEIANRYPVLSSVLVEEEAA